MHSDLIRRSKTGDAQAFDEIVSSLGHLVLSVARRMLGRREDAEDVAQEVFLRLYRSIHNIDENRSLEPWLVRVTVNVAKNQQRRDRSSREDSLSDHAEPPGSTPAKPDSRLRAQDVRVALRLAALSLPRQQGIVFMLRDLEGLEVATVAEALDISPVTVRRQSGSARRKVLTWIEKHRPELVSRPPASSRGGNKEEVAVDADERSARPPGSTK